LSGHKYSLPSIGGYGYVFVAQDTQTGREYALKVIKKNGVMDCREYLQTVLIHSRMHFSMALVHAAGVK
jgi:serine/threonine protein kinase